MRTSGLPFFLRQCQGGYLESAVILRLQFNKGLNKIMHRTKESIRNKCLDTKQMTL